MNREEHCGFTNYETFSVAVVVDNDRAKRDAMHAYVRATVEAYEAMPLDDDGRHPGGDLDGFVAESIKVHEDMLMPELDGYWSALLHSGWCEVDWLDLARHWLEEESREITAVADDLARRLGGGS